MQRVGAQPGARKHVCFATLRTRENTSAFVWPDGCCTHPRFRSGNSRGETSRQARSPVVFCGRWASRKPSWVLGRLKSQASNGSPSTGSLNTEFAADSARRRMCVPCAMSSDVGHLLDQRSHRYRMALPCEKPLSGPRVGAINWSLRWNLWSCGVVLEMCATPLRVFFTVTPNSKIDCRSETMMHNHWV